MSKLTFFHWFAVAFALTALCMGALAQKTVYKWVDDDGVIHFSDSPPDEAAQGEVRTMAIPNAPSIPAATPPATSAARNPVPSRAASPPEPASDAPVVVAELELSEMSLADLDMRCEAARERKIAPLREAEIAKCKADRRNDPAWCERFNADFGDAGRTIAGTMRPRMFDDLPECVEALQERNRRGR